MMRWKWQNRRRCSLVGRPVGGTSRSPTAHSGRSAVLRCVIGSSHSRWLPAARSGSALGGTVRHVLALIGDTSRIDHRKSLPPRGGREPAIEAHHVQRCRIVMSGNQGSRELEAVGGTQGMYTKQSLRRATDRIARKDLVPCCCQPLRGFERSISISCAHGALTFATRDGRSDLHGRCPPCHDLRVLLVELENSLASRLINDERENCRGVPIAHRRVIGRERAPR